MGESIVVFDEIFARELEVLSHVNHSVGTLHKYFLYCNVHLFWPNCCKKGWMMSGVNRQYASRGAGDNVWILSSAR